VEQRTITILKINNGTSIHQDFHHFQETSEVTDFDRGEEVKPA